MKHSEFEKSKVFNIKDLSEYESQAVVINNVIKKNTGNVSAISVSKDERISDDLSRFDHFVQIVDGKAEIKIDNQSYQLKSGECIIIPANSKNTIMAREKFKMISVIIKSGYE